MKKELNLKKTSLVNLNRITWGVILLVFSDEVLAYIDPGTGGMVVGSVWPMIIAALVAIGGFFVKIFYKPIRNIFLNLRKK